MTINESLRELLKVLKETNEICDKFVRQASSTVEEIHRFAEGRGVHENDPQPNEDGGAQRRPGEGTGDRGLLSDDGTSEVYNKWSKL